MKELEMVIEKLINEENFQKAVNKMYEFIHSISDEDFIEELYECLPESGEMIKDLVKQCKYSISKNGDITKLEDLNNDMCYNYYNSDAKEIVIYNLTDESVYSALELIESIINKHSLKKAN